MIGMYDWCKSDLRHFAYVHFIANVLSHCTQIPQQRGKKIIHLVGIEAEIQYAGRYVCYCIEAPEFLQEKPSSWHCTALSVLLQVTDEIQTSSSVCPSI